MRTHLSLLFLLFSPWLAMPLRADPPTDPLLRSPGDFARWQVVSVYSDTTPKKSRPNHRARATSIPPENRQQKLVTTRTGRMIHEERTDLAGHTTDVWYDGNAQYTRSPGGSGWFRVSGASGDSSYQPPPELGYRDVDLVRPENYAGTLTYDKIPCLVFIPGPARKIDWTKPAAAQKQLKALDTLALVNAETRLPVEIRAGGETRTFRFDPPPARMQTLPADLLVQTKKGDDARARLNQPAPRPY